MILNFFIKSVRVRVRELCLMVTQSEPVTYNVYFYAQFSLLETIGYLTAFSNFSIQNFISFMKIWKWKF